MTEPPNILPYAKNDLTLLRVNNRDSALHMLETREALFRRDILYLIKERDFLNEKTERLGQMIRAQEAEIASLRLALDHEREQLGHEKRMSAMIRASHSWKLGAPVRAVASTLRRVFGSQPLVLDPPPAPAPALLALPAQEEDGLREDGHAVPRLVRPRGKILVAADYLPLFDQHSGGLRLKTIIDLLSGMGWSLVFGSLLPVGEQPGILATAEGRSRYEEFFRQLGVVGFLHGMDEISDFLRVSGRDLDWAFLSFPDVASAIIPVLRSHARRTRIVFDMVDFHALRLAREAELQDSADLRREADRYRAIEIACTEAADLTFAVSEDEKTALLALAPQAVVEVLPNIFDIPEETPAGVAGRKGLLFLGGFWHRPNGDAVCWFVDRILPRILAEAPETVLTIVGSNMTEEVRALGQRPGVEALGFVDDLGPVFRSSRAFVAPLRYGAGMKGKVGQSMAHGLPVVATQIGAEGMNLRHAEHILVADREEEFASEVLRLLRDDALWTRLSEKGRQHIQATLSVPVVGRQLEALLSG